ncbi:MAG: thioredoxin family protein [Bacteroidetes bacterium]|nr:thioredoxin family protein [Bacteroidota bacterium]HET6244146.1 cytochrome c biogenesis protein CcdA [Bacteroidia bacterium]
MRRRYLINLFVFISILFTAKFASAQMYAPVKWDFSVKNINESERELIFTATINHGWHLYSQQEYEDGPIPTSFHIEKSPSFKLNGKVLEGKSINEFDSNFGIELKYFKNKAVFTQKIKAISTEKFKISGVLEFMVCDNEKCLPPEEIEFSFAVDGFTLANNSEVADVEPQVKVDTIQVVEIEQGKDPLPTIKNSDLGTQPNTLGAKSFWGIFIAGFLGGFLALLTPCVFPMIPLTVSFFTKKSKTRMQGIGNALIYGASIIVIYVALGFIITKILGPDAMNSFASNVWMNLLFFVIFIVFAISFLGAFEITLPASWINKADSASDRGGFIGIFFMAFTLSLVSFSCTGPIIGTLLVEASVGGNNLGPLVGMAGFSTALALPFGLFAAFPGWLNSLPKSGGWLNSVKVVLGLLELALAIKFLSNADMVSHWGIITREVFIALWIIIFIVLGFYLLGKIKFSHDSDIKHVSIPRLFLSILTFSFVVYLIPGMWGAPLKIISGFPPPSFYSEGWNINGSSSSQDENQAIVEGIDKSKCPLNLPCFKDYDLALAYAQSQGKPLMVDFTGWSCVNCRKMEEQVWVDPRVLTRLKNDYVLVSLYVDDKTKLPQEEIYISPVTGKKIKTIGNKWSDLQTTRFKTNSQPLYVLLDNNEQLLNEPTAYDTDIEKYIAFLDSGKAEFTRRKEKKVLIKSPLS